MSFCTTSLEIQHKELDIKLRELSAELRCMVCQNQSLLDSDSDLANDLKKLIYQKLKEGKSKDEIKSFLVDRYGEFILFKPLFSYTNLILWMAPFISILIIGFIGFRKIKQQK
tara:strand:+ start:437 stop:775 length:339 start_codon:yes stop_codon:yes gene_type:complete